MPSVILFSDIHLNMSNKAKSFGGSLDYIYICPHRPEDGCSCRKPLVGLFLKAQKDLNLDFSNMYFIGDQDTDKEAANKLKINYINLDLNKKISKKKLPKNVDIIIFSAGYIGGIDSIKHEHINKYFKY